MFQLPTKAKIICTAMAGFISGNTNALVKYELPEDTPGEEFPKVKPSKKKSEKMESKKAVRTDPLEESIS